MGSTVQHLNKKRSTLQQHFRPLLSTAKHKNKVVHSKIHA